MTDTIPLDREMKRTCSTFHLALDAYRELIAFLSESIPALEKAQLDRLTATLQAKFKEIPTDERPGVAAFLTSIVDRVEKNLKAKTEQPEENETESTAQPVALESLNYAGVDAIAFFLKQTERHFRIRQGEKLYSAVITGLVAQFEVLVGDLAREFYRIAPNAVDAKAKSLSLADLEQLGSIDAAIEYLIDNKVDGLLSESLDDWVEFFKAHLKFDAQALTDDWDRVAELVQRRHIIMHAGGRISRRYLNKVSPKLVAELHQDRQVGAMTGLNKAYVEAALDRIEVFGSRLAFNVWVRLQRKELQVCETVLTEWLYDRLLEGRWSVALPIASEGAGSARLSSATRLVCQMNEWLCYKRLGRFSEVVSGVESLDLSAMNDTYRLARFALLDRDESFFEMVERTKGGGLDKKAWTEWPLFDELRKTTRFQEYASRYGAEESSSSAAIAPPPTEATPLLTSGESPAAEADGP